MSLAIYLGGGCVDIHDEESIERESQRRQVVQMAKIEEEDVRSG